MARVIAVCNQKGGVGKTTTAVNLSAYLASIGRRALLVDFDPQANASSSFGIDARTVEKSVYHGLTGENPFSIVHASGILNHAVIPSSLDLAGAPIELVHADKREFKLRSLLMHFRHIYDYIIIDLPPSLDLLTINGLMAADEVIIPVQAEYYSLEGLGQLLSTMDLIRKNLRHDITVSGALITMYDRRSRLNQDVAKDLRRHFPHNIFRVEIPRNVQLAEAPSFSQPILMYAPSSKGARAYHRLARELISQEAERMRQNTLTVSTR